MAQSLAIAIEELLKKAQDKNWADDELHQAMSDLCSRGGRPSGKLTLKQEAFCRAYFQCHGNASEAYRKSYNAKNMKPESIHRLANGVLSNVKVASRIAQLKKTYLKRLDATPENITLELAKIAFSDMGEFTEWGPGGLVNIKNSSELSSESRACVAEFSETTTQNSRTVKFKLHDKVSALNSLARIQSMFKDNVKLDWDPKDFFNALPDGLRGAVGERLLALRAGMGGKDSPAEGIKSGNTAGMPGEILRGVAGGN